MYSYHQIFKKKNFFRKPHNTANQLRDNPQKRGQVYRVRVNTPRKPNSARRKTLKLKFSNKLRPVAYIPAGAHPLKRFSTVLVRGRGPRDTPGVYLSAIRGKFDLLCPEKRKARPSIYGIKKPNRKKIAKERRKKKI